MHHCISHGYLGIICKLQGAELPLLVENLVRHKYSGVCCHLSLTKLPDIRELLSEIFRSILRGMVAQYSTEYDELECLDIGWFQSLFSSHIHEANVF